MGVYLNPGNQDFRKSIRSKIYVDKTKLIACTNKLLVAYYSNGCDSKELFAGFKIENDKSFSEHLNQYMM